MAKDGPSTATPEELVLSIESDPATTVLDAHVHAAQGGDHQATEHLYRHFTPRLRRYVRSHVHDDHAVADVVADAWLQILTGVTGFSGTAVDFERWIVTITRHRMIDHIRGQVRRTSRDTPLDELIDLPSDADLETRVFERLAGQRLWKALAALPHAEAQAAVVYLVWGWKADEAGRLLGRTPRAVRTAAARARAKLRAISVEPVAAAELASVQEGAGLLRSEYDGPHQATGS